MAQTKKVEQLDVQYINGITKNGKQKHVLYANGKISSMSWLTHREIIFLEEHALQRNKHSSREKIVC